MKSEADLLVSSRRKSHFKLGPRIILSILISVLISFELLAQAAYAPKQGKSDADWPAYGRDPGGSRYSPLTQINRDDVKNLKVAWTYRTGAADVKGRSAHNAAFEATPIFVDGTLYLSTPFNRVIALDPLKGTERWSFDPKVDLTTGYSEVSSRGVSSWADRRSGKRRIYVATIDARLIALDATTGEPCKDFARDGQIDLTRDVRLVDRGDYQVTSPPAVIGDLIIVGSSIGDNRGVELERGVVRAYDARTGKLEWSWEPIPQADDDPTRKTWLAGSATRTGAANAWSIISADPERGLVFVPTGSPSPDFYGGERKGNNEYANSVVALRASTGKVVWHFQVVHHDLWDYDVASQPLLTTVQRDGRNVAAVVVNTKMGHVFVLDRETGKPLFPIEERRVPASDVAGEEAARTQPFPVLPPPLYPSRFSVDQAWGSDETERKACRDQIAGLRYEGVFTPPSLKGTMIFPGYVGGVNWGSASAVEKRGIMVVNVNQLAFWVRLIPRAQFVQQSTESSRIQARAQFTSQTGTPY